MALVVLRAIFVAVSIGIAVLMFGTPMIRQAPAWVPWAVLLVMIALPLAVIGIDSSLRRKDLTVITAIYFGLLVGVFLTYIALLALTPILAANSDNPVASWLPLILGMILCYICTSLLLQTRDDFRFLIPYVEFARDVKGLRPNILDASAIVDGRVDVLGMLRDNKTVDIEVLAPTNETDSDSSEEQRVVAMARQLGGRILTSDPNVVKIASVRSVQALSINDIALALKPTFVAGDMLDVRLVKPGEGPGQGVGYLDDGTMVVVEGGRDQIGRLVHASVTSTLHTSAGKLVFAKPEFARN